MNSSDSFTLKEQTTKENKGYLMVSIFLKVLVSVGIMLEEHIIAQ